jgi:hypothetical protein
LMVMIFRNTARDVSIFYLLFLPDFTTITFDITGF